MLFDPETASHLKPWLVRTLEPICDAEPGALADYILALLKHNAPETEMRKELAGQLQEFLEKETGTFVDTLFTALRTKSYLPYSATSSSAGFPSNGDAGIPIPLDALMTPTGPTSPERGRKRSLEADDRDFRPPAKGPRLDRDGQFSRHGRNEGHRSSWGGQSARMGLNGRGDFMDGGMGMGMQNGRPGYQPPGAMRGICRDYHNNGYCARGAYCKYSHGEDAVIPSQLFPMNGGPGGIPFMPMMGNGMGNVAGTSNAAYDPHERMDMRPMQGQGPSVGSRSMYPRAPMIPREGDTSNHMARKPGELPVIQDLTPHRPQDDRAQLSRDQGPRAESTMQDMTMGAKLTNGPSPLNGLNGMGGPQDVEMAGPSIPHQSTGTRGFRGGRGGGRGGHGFFGGDVQSFRPERRNDKTLVVEKIPEDKLSLGSVNEWFKRFGTVTNVAVDTVSAKALVTFSNHDEALTAWKSEDAVFGNRFVKVFWHRPMEGHGQVGQRALAASAPLMANLATKDAPPAAPSPFEASTPQPTPSTSTYTRKPSTTPASSAAAALAAKQKVLEQQIAEQKSLMAQLSTASAEDKKNIMARLRKLGEEMKPSAPIPPPANTPSPAPVITKARSATPNVEDKQRLERERLDKELELHAVTATEGEGEENTEELKAMLAKLKAEAASLGLSDAAEGSYSVSTYRPYRGRARGRALRGGYRGAMRGGLPRGSMKLDLRPKKLLFKGISGDGVQAIRDWYEPGGQVESVDTTDDGDAIVSFRSRAAAEQALAKGTNIPSIGQVQISWHQASQLSAAKPAPNPPEAPSGVDDKAPPEERPGSPSSPDDSHMHEEIGAAGWGGDDGEDGFGMI